MAELLLGVDLRQIIIGDLVRMKFSAILVFLLRSSRHQDQAVELI